jgi:hypothetical protein
MGNKMKEWFEANQEIYAEFKSKIHSTLDILSQDGTSVAECDDTDSLQNMQRQWQQRIGLLRT